MIGHIVRRAYTAAQQLQTDENEVANFLFPTWGKILLGVLFATYLLHMSLIRYVYGEVITTLAMVEDVNAAIPVQVDTHDSKIPSPEKEEKSTLVEEAVVLVKAKPITSGLRNAAIYLRSHGGFRGLYRGFGAFILYELAFWTLTQVLGSIFVAENLPSSIAGYIAAIVGIIAAVLAAPLNVLWTHIVISRHAPTHYLRGLFSLNTYKQVGLATIVKTIAEQVTFALPLALFGIYDLEQYLIQPAKLSELSPCDQRLLALKGLSLVLVYVGTAILILVPATVTLTRVQASLLAEDQETIVPFDRTFGGKLVPTAAGGSGKLGMLDAWKTYAWAARMNLLKLYAKVACHQALTQVLFGTLLFCALQGIMGGTFDKARVLVISKLQNGM